MYFRYLKSLRNVFAIIQRSFRCRGVKIMDKMMTRNEDFETE